MGAWLQDFRYSLRSLRKSLGLTCVVILTLGLGIGFNTAIYSVVNAFLLRPLPVKDPGQLVVLASRDKHTEVPHGMSFADYRDYRGLTDVFSGVLARREFAFATNWKRDHHTDRIWVDAITPNYFQLLGVSTALGRTFQPDEMRQPIAVLDHTCWREKFGGDRGILGQNHQPGRASADGDRRRARGFSGHAGCDASRYLRPAASARPERSDSGTIRAEGRS